MESSTRANYDFSEAEQAARDLWQSKQVYERAKSGNLSGPKFYFVDGPPYTSGKVHLGTTWNKILKDMVLRYKRMNGYHVWDRPGYDMHGLPTEKATEKALKIERREQIDEMGVDKFVDACRDLCLRNMDDMTAVFKFMGIWMDWKDPYMSVSRDYMEGEWWLVKKAHDLGRLYEGERTITWDSVNGTALAKHELFYQEVEDTAIYVRLKVLSDLPEWADTYLVVWTTTPWTIPFNLAVMVNPEFDYCVVSGKFPALDSKPFNMVVTADRLKPFLEEELKLTETDYRVVRTVRGADLFGLNYEHPFARDTAKYAELKQAMPKVHTVVLSSEYVTTAAGTGLVHCAPGCGPEDYEVGHRNGLKPFNVTDMTGVFRGLAPFDGLVARKDDPKFIQLLKDRHAVVHAHLYKHEYPFGERSKEAVIFRTTKQWFLKVEDLKPTLLAENAKVTWNPPAAGNQFRSWLENLRDNSISKQRFWGTPLPVWRSEDDPTDYRVVGSVRELVELAELKEEPQDLHIPVVDKIVLRLKGRDGQVHNYRRVPDVLDVWVDAGTASWNCLGFPAKVNEDTLKEWGAMEFISEGKDQIRGWFNLLHILSVIVTGKAAFKHVNMHGFINDAYGRKFSKSLGNYVLPEEVTSKYGVDALRYYMSGAAAPGLDMNYNFDDIQVKVGNMKVFWNMVKLCFDSANASDVEPVRMVSLEQLLASGCELQTEEKYLLSRLHTTIAAVDAAFAKYNVNEVAGIVEDFLLGTLSHTYLQLVWEKSASGSEEEKRMVTSLTLHALVEAMTLFAPVVPHFSEYVYQTLKKGFPSAASMMTEDSVHLRPWPKVDARWLDAQLEADMALAQDAISAVLAARDKCNLAVKWPVKDVRLTFTTAQNTATLERCRELIVRRTNTRALSFEPPKSLVTVKPNAAVVGKQFGRASKAVSLFITENREKVLQALSTPTQRETFTLPDGSSVELGAEHLQVIHTAPPSYQKATAGCVQAFLDTTRTPELDEEGYLREVVRRVQMLRKKMTLQRKDRVSLVVASTNETVRRAVTAGSKLFQDRAGVVTMTVSDNFELPNSCEGTSTETVKGEMIVLGASRV